MDRRYFDHNASAPVSAAALAAYTGALAEVYGNASSIHQFGQKAKLHLEGARRRVAELLGCQPREIVFVSGGTEADNLALFGMLAPGAHVITSAIEHPAILNACAHLESEGVEVTRLAPDGRGSIDPDDVRCAVRSNTALISVMHANNETGVLQPIAEISAVAKDAGVVFHSDGVQAAGRIEVDVRSLGVDLYSISGHKLGAPKGIGALYVREGIRLRPLIYGGRHERDRRAGTENVPGAIGLAAASTVTHGIDLLRDRLENAILDRVPQTSVNGAGAPRIPNTTNICFHGIEAEPLVIALDLEGFAVSTGSACSSGAVEPSHVLSAMGLDAAQARASVRFSLGPTNVPADVDALVDAVDRCTARLRRLSPTYAA